MYIVSKVLRTRHSFALRDEAEIGRHLGGSGAVHGDHLVKALHHSRGRGIIIGRGILWGGLDHLHLVVVAVGSRNCEIWRTVRSLETRHGRRTERTIFRFLNHAHFHCFLFLGRVHRHGYGFRGKLVGCVHCRGRGEWPVKLFM